MEATLNETSAPVTAAVAATPAPSAGSRRRAAAPSEVAATQGQRRGVPPALAGGVALAALVAGIAIGAAGMRQRHNAKEALVAINGRVINQWELFGRLENEAGPDALRRMMGEEMQLQFAKSQGVVITDAQVQARIKELKARPGFAEEMSKRGLTEGALVQQVRSELARNGVLSRGCDPTDAQVREFYKFNSDPKNPKGIFYTPETVSLVAIVTETEGMARSAARDIAAGVPFTTAAKTYSKDPTKGAGIGISALQRGRTQYKAIPGFEATVFAMKIGDQVGPRQLGGKWWVIRCMDKKPAVTIPFEKVKGDCRGFLALQMGRTKNGKKVEEEFAKWRKEGRIVALTPRYQSVVDAAKE